MGNSHMFTAEARAWGSHPHRGASDFCPGCVSSEPARGALGGGKAVGNGYIIIYYYILSYIIIYNPVHLGYHRDIIGFLKTSNPSDGQILVF